MDTKKIGILGGTFDPPHIGHLIMATEAKFQCNLDEIWFMPSATPPHKNREVTHGEHRIAMVREMIARCEGFEVTEIEFERKGPSYTVDTIQQLKEDHADARFYFIIGGDMVDSLHTWDRIEQLMEMVTFIGVKRPGYEFESPYMDRILTIETPLIGISSTMLRNRFAGGENTKYYVSEEVRKYIEVNGLYEAGRSTENR
ncbi:nicotinate-nucleotide adenylyltransferase [Pseudalkalibacillus sp. Hm43]|uniref:nicotinate-nucleotide adenylyltransferase n=1 Tax=Pseudalkalibacillus sp. Hm43 TaxID=3450742 RepID=UPI003F426B9F